MTKKSLSKRDAPKNISNNEKQLGNDDFIVSKTDLKGKIIYCNEIFTKMSGYQAADLIGANHNLIRHPDMPQIAFKVAWDLIQDKKEFFGFVKNLCAGHKMGLFSKKQNNEAELISQITKVLKNIENGKLASRIVLSSNNTPMENIAWSINNSLDQMEVVLRESRNNIQAITAGQMYRSMFPAGLKGEFKETAVEIGRAMNSMKANEKYKQMGEMTTTFSTFNGGMKGNLDIISTDINKTEEAFADVTSKTSQAAEAAKNTFKAVEETNSDISSLSELVTNTSDSISELDNNVNDITMVVNLIKDIAFCSCC